MTILTLLRDADYVALMGANIAIVFFSFVAYRRTKLLPFALLSAGMLLEASLVTMLQIHGYVYQPGDDPTIYYIYRGGLIVAIGLNGTGIVMLIRRFAGRFHRADTARIRHLAAASERCALPALLAD